MRVGSLFSGIGGLDAGLARAGLTVAWHAESDEYRRAVLAHRFLQHEAIYADVHDVSADAPPIDLLAFGFPCQDVSVAGRRAGLAGKRTGLFWEAIRVANDLRPRWLLAENVPGLLTSNRGEDFASCLEALTGYRPDVPGRWRSSGKCSGPRGSAVWRVLDSRYFGVAQRRRRVFVVVRVGGDCPPAVLLERQSVHGDSPPRRNARTDAAADAQCGTTGDRVGVDYVGTLGGRRGPGAGEAAAGHLVPDVAHALTTSSTRNDPNGQTFVAYGVQPQAGGSAFRTVHRRHGDDVAHTMRSPKGGGAGGGAIPMAFIERAHLDGGSDLREQDYVTALAKGGGKPGQGYAAARVGGRVRKLTPRECERLQGLPDDWTLIDWLGKPAPDSRRYAALGDAVTANVAEWIGRRILVIDDHTYHEEESC